MGHLTHTVGGDSNLVSFRSPARVPVESLKCHFSPIQNGSGDPSPVNVRPITGWTGVEAYKRGKNLVGLENRPKYEYDTLKPESIINLNNLPVIYGFAANGNGNKYTEPYDVSITSNEVAFTIKTAWYGIGFTVQIEKNQEYSISYNIISSKTHVRLSFYTEESKFISYLDVATTRSFTTPSNAKYLIICVTGYGASETVLVRDIQLELGSTATSYEPYQGETIPVTFPVLGKNKFNWNVEESISTPAGSDPSNARSFIPDTYVVGMSVNNYYRQNYSSWVLNPSVSNGVISFSSGVANGYGIAFPLKLAAGQSYFLSGTGDGYAGATYYDKDGNTISYQNNRLNKTITVPNNTIITLIGFYASNSNSDFTFSNIQLELGSEATAYEPYNPNNTVYGGYVDLAAGEVVAEWVSCNFTSNVNPSASWYSTDINRDTIGVYRNAAVWYNTPYPVPVASGCMFDYCKIGTVYSENTPWVARFLFTSNSFNRFEMRLPKSVLADVSTEEATYQSVKDYLDAHPLQAVYQIAPIHYPLTPTQIQTLLDRNNFYSNTNGNTEVSYAVHDTAPIRAAKKRIAANEPHIITPVSAGLVSFSTDMIAPLKECKVGFAPVQDLHGYNNPWPGGGNVNLANFVDSNGIALNGDIDTTATARTATVNAIPVTQGKNYYIHYKETISGSSAEYRAILAVYLNGALIQRTTGVRNGSNLAVSGGNEFRVCIYDNAGSGTASISTNAPMVTNSSTAPDKYYPYSNICPISGWAGCDVYGAGKNLVTADLQFYSGRPDASVYQASATNQTIAIPIPQNATVHWHKSGTGSSPINYYGYVCLADELPYVDMPVYESTAVRNVKDLTFQTGNHKYLLWSVDTQYFSTVMDLNSMEGCVNVGSTIDYAPIGTGTTIPIDWTDSSGTIYGGYVDLVRGEVVEEYGMVDLGTLTWTKNGTYAISRFYTTALENVCAHPSSSWTLPNWYCTNYRLIKQADSWSQEDVCSVTTGGTFYIMDSAYSDAAAFKTAMSGVMLAYKLATPIHHTIDPATLRTLRGVNNVWSNTNGTIDLSYWSH